MNFDLQKLSVWQRQAFAAGLLQRMLPNYAYFSNAVDFGDFDLLKNQLDLIWQKLSLMPIKLNLEIQLDKLQAIIPDERDFDIFAVYPAIDVCSGMVCLWESFQENEINSAQELSLLSENTVFAYLQLKFKHEPSDSKANSTDYDEITFNSDPLIIWEREVQKELFDLITGVKPSKKSCEKIKELVMKDRLSNLAIEY